jgi:DNA-binding GntR family transcriptional regulator
MINIFELREVLEGLSARRMASQITNTQIIKLNGFFKQFANSSDIKDVKAYAKEDRRFHDFVTSVGSNEFIKSILESYNIISYSYQLVNFEGLVRPPNETINEHLAIIERISKRDSEVAEELMRQHFKESIAFLRQNIETDIKQSAVNSYKFV